MKASTATRLALVALAGMLTFVTPTAPAVAAHRSGYVTILFGRTQFTTVAGDCEPLPSAVDLDEVASDLAARGLTAMGTTVVNRTNETGSSCWGRYALEPDRRWIQARDADGWGFVSAGRDYMDMTTLSPAAGRRESCGSLEAFAAHGIEGAEGLFAYPNNRYTVPLQIKPVSKCFMYGRRYDTIDHPNVRADMVAPWFAKTYSVNGGTCNDPALPCYTVSGTPEDTPAYRYATGSRVGTALSSDRTSSDWRRHYTSRQEVYCYDDFLTIMDGLPDATTTGVTVTDPSTVARAWKP